LEIAGLDNDRLDFGGLENGLDGLEFGRLEEDGLQIVKIHGH